MGANVTKDELELYEDRSYQAGMLRIALGRLEVHAASASRMMQAFDIQTAELDSAILNARLALSLVEDVKKEAGE